MLFRRNIFVGKTAYIKDLYSKIELDPEHMEGLTNSYIMSSREIDFDDSNASIRYTLSDAC